MTRKYKKHRFGRRCNNSCTAMIITSRCMKYIFGLIMVNLVKDDFKNIFNESKYKIYVMVLLILSLIIAIATAARTKKDSSIENKSHRTFQVQSSAEQF